VVIRYFKKFWDETSGEELTDSWGNSTYYFEADEQLCVIRQVQVFQNDKILKYDRQNRDDVFGGLADQLLDRKEFAGNEISAAEFLTLWTETVSYNELIQ